MAQCKQCGKSGFMLSLSKGGLCNECSFTFGQLTNLLNECTAILSTTNNIETIYSRSVLAVQVLEKLKTYDHLNFINPLPDKIIEQIHIGFQDLFISKKIKDNDKLNLDVTIYGNGYRCLIQLKGAFYYDSELNAFYQKVKEQSISLWERFNKISVSFTDSFKQGYYNEYYKSGKLLRELPFILTGENSYEVNGIEKTYYEGENDEGKSVYVLLEENKYKNGERIGISKRYGTNGKITSESNNDNLSDVFSNGVFGMEYKDYYPNNGKLKLDNQKDFGKEYYESGKLKADWTNENYMKKGIHTEYYESGQVKMKVLHIDSVNRDGLMQKYFEDGTLKELWSYDKGIRLFIKKYYPSGQIKSEWLYNNGELTKKTEYNVKGEITKIS